MSVNGVVGVLSSLVTVALVTTIVSHKNSASVLTAAGNAFKGALLAAQGVK